MGREFTPFTIGERFRILPEAVTPPDDGRIDIIMAAGAFGSGEHETTASCLEIMEKHPNLVGSTILDLGSGTGILSIAAIKLGAAGAVCVDIDPLAVDTCSRNCTLNGVADKITNVCGTMDDIDKTGFDFILANIYGDILLDVAEDMVAAGKAAAPMLLSGILFEYNFDVRNRYSRLGCKVISNKMMNEFSTVLLVNRH